MSLDAIAPPLDLAALAYFVVVLAVYRAIVGRQGRTGAGLVGAIQRQRVSWMLNMARRDQRMLDAILLGSLGQGNAFFASTSAITVGGLAATLGAGERLQAMLARLPFVAPPTPGLWELKQISRSGH